MRGCEKEPGSLQLRGAEPGPQATGLLPGVRHSCRARATRHFFFSVAEWNLPGPEGQRVVGVELL